MIDLLWWAEGCGGRSPYPYPFIAFSSLHGGAKHPPWLRGGSVTPLPMQAFAPQALDDPSMRDATSRGVIV